MGSARVRLGDVLGGRYRLVSVAGRGGIGVVHRARDEASGERVLVTVVYARARPALDRAAAPGVAADLAGIRHPGLVPVLGASDPDDEVAYVVAPVVEGRSLAAVLADGPLERQAAVTIAADVADALAALHAAGRTHRNVKPASILLPEEGGARLLDAGLTDLFDVRYYTAYERLFGTAAYVSPEQVWNAPAGPATDVYALGLVLIEALTAVPAFAVSSAADAVARTFTAPPIPPAPPALQTLLARMTAIEPEARPSAAEVAAALGPAPVQVLPSRLQRSALTGAAVVAGIALAAGALLSGGSSGAAGRTVAALPTSRPAAGAAQDLRAALGTVPTPSPSPTARPAKPAPRAPRPTATPSPVAAAPAPAPAPTETAPPSPRPTAKATPTPTPTPTPTRTPTPSPTPTPTPTPTPIPTPSPSPSVTPSPTPRVDPPPSPE